MTGKQYNTGLLMGRAYAHASDDGEPGDPGKAVDELQVLANGDRVAVVLAMARFREYVNGPAPTDADERALRLLERTLTRLDDSDV